jgi:hypothetical protein
MCPCGLRQLRGRHVLPRLGAGPGPPRAPVARGSSGAATCHLGFSTHLLTQGVSPGFCGLQENKQISFGDPAIMISIEAGTPISSNALHDKGCSARS